ncbi:hypothetical protein E2562_000200 [Oryza meyeriana var. granulata]|uniref:Uncharacterized protein n=1 Tax=Oryza meyeriana var. granulata TaxID=110450 RepID=A0A6G1DBT0_9ORYZ|nr:hypothetical protein E2562_000200 [Oryza meyeriana var. granulata]
MLGKSRGAGAQCGWPARQMWGCRSDGRVEELEVESKEADAGGAGGVQGRHTRRGATGGED